jgi:protoporphyrinogen oxidase
LYVARHRCLIVVGAGVYAAAGGQLEDILILGGGVAGIATAYFAGRNGKKAVVVEACPRPGGLLDNFQVQGFRFELGPHYSYSAPPEVRAEFDRVPHVLMKPEGWCWYNGTWIRHPVQDNLNALPLEERVAFLDDLINRPSIEARNYHEWLTNRYGHLLTNRFLAAYCQKVWTLPARELDIDWVGERMQLPDVRTVLRGAMSSDGPNTYFIKEARYPADGGFLSFIRPMIEEIDIRCNRMVAGIDYRRRTVLFSDGEEMQYKTLVNTLPLPRFIDMTYRAPEAVRNAAAGLMANQIDLISIGFSRPDVVPHLWFYIYDPDLWAARAHTPRLLSPNNVPSGCDSVQFEFYSSPRHPQRKSPGELFQNAIDTLDRLGIGGGESVLFWQHTHIPYANVIHEIGMRTQRDAVLAWVEEIGVLSVGRFGRWSYDSVADTISWAARAAERLGLAAPLGFAPASASGRSRLPDLLLDQDVDN